MLLVSSPQISVRKTFFLHKAHKLLHKILAQPYTSVFVKKNKISQLHLVSPMLGHQAANDPAIVFAHPNLIFSIIILPGKIFQPIQYIGLKVEAVTTFPRVQVAMYVGYIPKIAWQ